MDNHLVYTEANYSENEKIFLNSFKAKHFEDIVNLDLNNNTKSIKFIEYFPKLINLKCLILSNNNFDQIPSIECLITLEELYIRNLKITNSSAINSTTQQLSSESIKIFISKIKNLVNLKHFVSINSKFDIPTINDYLIYYLNNLETLNFKKITEEQREKSINNIKKIREKQQLQLQQHEKLKSLSNPLNKTNPINTSPTSSPLVSPFSKKKVNFSLSQSNNGNGNNKQLTPQKVIKSISNESKTPTKTNISTPIINSSKIITTNNKTSIPIKKIESNNNITLAIKLLIDNISSMEDIKLIEDEIKERKNKINNNNL